MRIRIIRRLHEDQDYREIDKLSMIICKAATRLSRIIEFLNLIMYYKIY